MPLVVTMSRLMQSSLFSGSSRHCYVRACVRLLHEVSSKPRLRFAPSPTGFLHLGGLRTALYNYLMCKSTGGTFVLRIEDTDQARIVPGAVENIQDSLKWMGISPDEGPSEGGSFGPYVQSQRVPIYQDHAEQLVQKNAAYRCFCTPLRLELLRKEAARSGAIPRYDNRCRGISSNEISKRLSNGESSVIRLKMDSRIYRFHDEIYGDTSCNAEEEADPIILKSDGFPTYHLANVVDDHLMSITHVLRGIEWQISTAKHLQLYDAFGWIPPKFAHLPLLLNSDGSKLSKRSGAMEILEYRKQGYYPVALLTLLAQIGGGFKSQISQSMDLVTKAQLVRDFDLTKINCNSCQINFSKLPEFNKKVIAEKMSVPTERKILVTEIRDMVVSKYGAAPEESVIEKVLEWSKERLMTIHDLVSKDLEFVWMQRHAPVSLKDDEKSVMLKVKDVFAELESSKVNTREETNKYLRTFLQQKNVVFRDGMRIMRLALCGVTRGPSVAEVIEILGLSECMNRIQRLCQTCHAENGDVQGNASVKSSR